MVRIGYNAPVSTCPFIGAQERFLSDLIIHQHMEHRRPDLLLGAVQNGEQDKAEKKQGQDAHEDVSAAFSLYFSHDRSPSKK